MAYKKDKRWVAYPHDPETGRKKYVGIFDTKREARAAETEFLKTRRPRRLVAAKLTCDEFADRWIRDYPRPKESTNLHNQERLKAFKRDFASVRLGDVDRVMAREWALKHKGNVSTVRAMFGDALRDGLVDINPFASLRMPQAKGRKHVEVLTEPDLLRLADTALRMTEWGGFANEYRAMLLFAGYTGIRPGELFALRREDLHGDFVNVQRALVKTRGGSFTIDVPKNGQTRTVVVPPPAQEALEDVSVKDSGLLFANPRDDRHWTQSSNYYYWRALRREFGRPELAWYTLRHTAATLLLERGLSPWDVAIQLGHTDGGQLVMSLYGHPSHAGARSRVLAAFGSDAMPGPTPISAPDRQKAVGEGR